MTTDEQKVWFNATHWCGIIGHGVVNVDRGGREGDDAAVWWG